MQGPQAVAPSLEMETTSSAVAGGWGRGGKKGASLFSSLAPLRTENPPFFCLLIHQFLATWRWEGGRHPNQETGTCPMFLRPCLIVACPRATKEPDFGAAGPQPRRAPRTRARAPSMPSRTRSGEVGEEAGIECPLSSLEGCLEGQRGRARSYPRHLSFSLRILRSPEPHGALATVQIPGLAAERGCALAGTGRPGVSPPRSCL